MRGWPVLFVVACGSGAAQPDAPPIIDAAAPDAAAPDAPPDAAPDAAPDAPPGCQPVTLLAGGMDVVAQGWSLVKRDLAAVSYDPDDIRLTTSTATGAKSGGQLLLVYPGAYPPGAPFAIEVVMRVEQVDPHNPLDAAAAILGAFTPDFGTMAERAQMIYLDAAQLGWSDNAEAFPATVQDTAFHTYRLWVDAEHVARVTFDGVAALTRAGFVGNGTLAVGDHTNEPGVDSTLRIRSVTRLCL